MEEDFSKDNRRNERVKAQADHFKGGKVARRHKDKVVETKMTSTQEAEISHIGFKVRLSLKEETLDIIKPKNGIKYPFNDVFITDIDCFPKNEEIELHIPKPIHEDGPTIDFVEKSLLSFIWEIDEKNNVYNKWCILNYMNPLVPGGGFEKDASAYEESLVLASGLYCSLTTDEAKKTYKKNKEYDDKHEDGVFRSDVIYAPKVPFFRDEDFDLVEDWQNNYRAISVINIPAVNYITYSATSGFSKDKYEELMRNRINRIFRTALKFGHTKLILGPWGAGLEGGPLKDIITWFSEDDLFDLFDEIYFVCDDEETISIMETVF
jgi:uncharacterized protein (TIGR02452 family)